MAKKDRYYVVAGTVQFDPEEREVSGSPVTDVVLKTIGSQKLVKVTLWSEFDIEGALGRAIDRGDLVVADGKYTTSEGKNGKTYHNLSPFVLHVNGTRIEKQERDIVNDDVEDDDEDEDAPF